MKLLVRSLAMSSVILSGGPWTSISTLPSQSFRTHPVSPRSCARYCALYRKPTPWTRPVKTRCFLISSCIGTTPFKEGYDLQKRIESCRTKRQNVCGRLYQIRDHNGKHPGSRCGEDPRRGILQGNAF